MTDADPQESGDVFVQSLARGLDVIRAFDAEHPAMILADVARRTGLSRSAARRLLHTLHELGLVWTDGKTFSLTPRILELGYSYLSGLGLPDIAQPHLQILSDEVHESCSVSVLVGSEIAYIARVPTKRIMSVGITIGTRFPAFATSMGRVLLASLDAAELDRHLRDVTYRPLTGRTVGTRDALEAEIGRVREQGWSLVDQELEAGLRSIAVPILNGTDEVVAAVNIGAGAIGGIDEFVDRLLEPLQRTADAIRRDLQFLRHPAPPLYSPVIRA